MLPLTALLALFALCCTPVASSEGGGVASRCRRECPRIRLSASKALLSEILISVLDVGGMSACLLLTVSNSGMGRTPGGAESKLWGGAWCCVWEWWPAGLAAVP